MILAKKVLNFAHNSLFCRDMGKVLGVRVAHNLLFYRDMGKV
jgi:hypothetical protein